VYTQCSKCETVFKLSAEVLRAAGGQVRCGKCGEVFNALARLAEDSSSFAAGESPLELETRADSILETIVPPQVARTVAKDYEEFGPPGVEIAQLEVLVDWDEEGQTPPSEPEVRAAAAKDTANDSVDRLMEFTLPPGELDRIFVESKKRTPQPGNPPAQQPQTQPSSQQAPRTTPKLVPQIPPPAAKPEPEQVPPHPESLAASALPSRGRVSGFDVPDEVRRDMLEEFEQHQLPGGVEQISGPSAAQRRPLILWAGAAIVSALLLIVQILHQNREWFIAHGHGPFGAGVRALYGVLGAPLPAPANLSGYQLRQWGVTGDPDANGTLRLRASILNTAAQLQPYPLLRVTLADRFGKGIGRRDFEPNEYLGKPTAKLLAPGERADATLEILDPGKNAEGFEIDVCLRGVDQKIACQGDVAPQTKR
jgi:predicted Zn finger-like uncharacterized protein